MPNATKFIPTRRLAGLLMGPEHDLQWFADWLGELPPDDAVYVTKDTYEAYPASISLAIFNEVAEDASGRNIKLVLKQVDVEGMPPENAGALGPAGALRIAITDAMAQNDEPFNVGRLFWWGLLGASGLGLLGLMLVPRYKKQDTERRAHLQRVFS
jgi:hypothetical protein